MSTERSEDFEQLVTDILVALDDFTDLRDGPDVDDAREAVMRELLAYHRAVRGDASRETLAPNAKDAGSLATPQAGHTDAPKGDLMPCNCKNCAAGLPDIYCVATRTLSDAEATRLEEILGQRVIDSTARVASPRLEARDDA